MVFTNFNGAGIGFGFGIGCGFGVGWGFGGMPLNLLGLGVGGGCGVGVGLGWGFGTAFGSQYRSSRITFQGVEFDNKEKVSFGSWNHGGRRIFTLSQVAQHKSNKDCWLVINGRMMNVTKFLEEHPGGEDVLTELAGKDATKEFDAVGHSKAAQNLLLRYQVGALQGYSVQEVDFKNVTFKESNKREMSAFVIKEDAVPKSHYFFEFFVPFLFAGFYLGYRYLTRADQITY